MLVFKYLCNSRFLGIALVAASSVAAGASCAGNDQEPDDASPAVLRSLVEAERDFARSAAQHGTIEAFRTHLADDAVLFRPRATNAQEFLQAQPAVPGLLSWEPVYADISAAGDLGYTTGPWEWREDPTGEATAYGNYFTVWKKQPDGDWKAVIDHGIFNPPPESAVDFHSPERDRSWRARALDLTVERRSLLEVDRAFAGAASTPGTVQALAAHVTSDVRALRNGLQPLNGIEALQELYDERPGAYRWTVQGGDVSGSGDLGYTYGEYEFTPAGTDAPTELGVYVRAWRRGPNGSGSWRVAVEVMTPLPSQLVE